MVKRAIENPVEGPTLAEIEAARRELGDLVVETPISLLSGLGVERLLGPETRVLLKLELFQRAGTFKPRGALLNMLTLSDEELQRGVTAVSAGNHAMAVAYAARTLGSTAKVVMPKNANAARVAGSRAYGAEVILVDNVHKAFEEVQRIEREEGRTFVHPFEGLRTVLGTSGVGLELMRQASTTTLLPEGKQGLDAVIVPVGGGGLCAGVATAVKRIDPGCQVYGVEPEGADTMHRSFAAGEPQAVDAVHTIADSLGAPHAAPYTFALCHRYVDELVKVSDDQLRAAMAFLFTDAKLAVEPAGAAATAALVGPLAERLRGKRVGLVVCGTNIDSESYFHHLNTAPS